MPKGAIIALYVLGAVAMVGLVKLLVFFSTAADTAQRTDMQEPVPAELLRVLVIHSQWLYIICNFVAVPWPSTLSVPMQVISGIWSSTSGSSVGLECVLSRGTGLPVAVQKVLIALFTPVGILCAVLLIEVLLHYLRPNKSARAGHDFAGLVMCIVFMFMPTWVHTALSLFACVPLDTPVQWPHQAASIGSYWVEDMAQLCYSRAGYHRGWALGLGIPLTFVLCAVLPAAAFCFMWISRKRGKLDDPQFQKHYSFMYRLWAERVCWYESVVLLQTIALVIVSTFGFVMGPYYSSLVTAAVLVVIATLLLVVKPFKCPTANKIAVVSVYVLFTTAYAALTFLSFNNAGPGPIYGNIMGVVILISNLAFFVGVIWKLVKVVDWAAIRAFFSKGCCSANKGVGGRPRASGGPGFLASLVGIVKRKQPTST